MTRSWYVSLCVVLLSCSGRILGKPQQIEADFQPTVKLQKHAVVATVWLKTDVVFECDLGLLLKGVNPISSLTKTSPQQVVWEHNGRLLDQRAMRENNFLVTEERESSMLRIMAMNKGRYEGLYRCYYTHNLQESITDPKVKRNLLGQVNFIPMDYYSILSPQLDSLVQVNKGDSKVLVCYMDRFGLLPSMPRDIVWRRNNQMIHVDRNYNYLITYDSVASKLIILHMEVEESVMFSCHYAHKVQFVFLFQT